MPAVPRPVIKARAARLREAGAAALSRHLEARVGKVLEGLVERPGLARAPDFTEIAFEGEAVAGSLRQMRITSHDGMRALAVLA
jgi:threonylcarbamoyladenosine tRNA methylthiotransferase MtaB